MHDSSVASTAAAVAAAAAAVLPCRCCCCCCWLFSVFGAKEQASCLQLALLHLTVAVDVVDVLFFIFLLAVAPVV